MKRTSSRLAVIAALAIGFSAAGNAWALECPPDVYTEEYDAYLDTSSERLGFVLDPQLYGSEQAMRELQAQFEQLEIPDEGITLVFTNEPGTTLYTHSCEGDCSGTDYLPVVAECSSEIGSLCLHFAVVIEGEAQCLMIPRPVF